MASKTDKQTTKTKAKASPKRGAATSITLDASRENETGESRQEGRAEMSTLKVQMPDGQGFELPEEIAGKDETLREALHKAYPDAATATFDRKTAGLVKVVKKAGTKGGVLEPAKEAESNGQFVGRLANYKQRRGRKRFTKEEQERIALWRAIFAAMEEEEEKANA